MRHHLTRSRRAAHEFSFELVAAVRFRLLRLASSWLRRRLAQESVPTHRVSELAAALDASKASGRYLRALRDHFDGMRGDVLRDRTLCAESPLVPDMASLPVPPPLLGNKLGCEQYTCMSPGANLAAELDLALATPTRHRKGAALACPGEGRRRQTANFVQLLGFGRPPPALFSDLFIRQLESAKLASSGNRRGFPCERTTLRICA
jgi:hypothetical protein